MVGRSTRCGVWPAAGSGEMMRLTIAPGSLALRDFPMPFDGKLRMSQPKQGFSLHP